MKILAISGSLRQGPTTRTCSGVLPRPRRDGVDIVLYHGLKEIPPYDADDDVPGNQPDAVRRLQGRARTRPTPC